VSGDDVHVGVAHGYERLVEVPLEVNLPGGAQEAAMWRAVDAALDGIGTHGDPS
jgi:hypothetical protein